MAQPLSYEDSSELVLITTKTLNGRLWFVNNPLLWSKVLGYLAKYSEMYGVVLYGFIIMGNHYHLIARFPEANRAKFMRAFNAMFAKLVAVYVPSFPGGKLWARRYSWQVLPREEDILKWFFYVVLNPVSSGLARCPSRYSTYNSYYDCSRGIERSYEVFDRMGYNERKRFDSNVKEEDFTSTYVLRFERIPGFESLSKTQYIKKMDKLHGGFLEEALKKHGSTGFPPPKALLATKPGSLPKNTKTSTRYSKRPLVLTLCSHAKRIFLEKYFALLDAFKEASRRFLAGDMSVVFPPGTYVPCMAAV